MSNLEGFKIKGSHWLAFEAHVDSVLSPGAFRVIAGASGAPVPQTALPGSWYPVELMLRGLEEAGRRTGRRMQDMVREVAAENARADLVGVYRVYLKLASPRHILANGNLLWRTYVSFGKVETLKNEPGNFASVLRGIPTERVLDWAEGVFHGFVPAALTVAGGQPVRSYVKRRFRETDGLFALEYTLTWK